MHSISEGVCASWILDALEREEGGWCVTVNLEILRRIQHDPSLRELVAGSSLRVADGITLVWASKIAGIPLSERVCGSSLIYSLTTAAVRRERSVFLLGGNEGVAAQAAAQLQQQNPGLRVTGTYCPPFGFDREPQKIDEIVARLQVAQPDIVYVALGFPKAEKLIAQIHHHLPKAWWIGVGISFSYVAGEVGRAPVWVQNLGLESYYRLAQEPRRLARRYLVDGPPFVALMLARSLLQRFGIGPDVVRSYGEASRPE
ncbi:MAG: WecB/TagA/CpsF family glycosyltransferase [Cyanobacteria bacterium J06641_5]